MKTLRLQSKQSKLTYIVDSELSSVMLFDDTDKKITTIPLIELLAIAGIWKAEQNEMAARKRKTDGVKNFGNQGALNFRER